MRKNRKKKVEKTFVTFNSNAADPHIVSMLAHHLTRSYEEFINDYPGTVDFVDGMMGIHNFYRAALDHLEEASGAIGWHEMAVGTLHEATLRKRGVDLNYVSADSLKGENNRDDGS